MECEAIKPEIDPEILHILESHGYQFDEVIGKGGFAQVIKVTNQRYQQTFAAKCFYIGEASHNHSISSYSAEVNALRDLCHPNIISIYDHFSQGKYLCIILEYCPFGTLSRLIVKGRPMSMPILFYVAKSLVSALSFCHQRNISHKDIKPSNVLIDPYQRLKLADFGLSQKTLSNSVLRFGGSLPFLSPEILERKSHNPFASDVWSLGVLFYLCAKGYLPFLGKTEKELLSSIYLRLGKSQMRLRPPLAVLAEPNEIIKKTASSVAFTLSEKAKEQISECLVSDFAPKVHLLKSKMPQDTLSLRESNKTKEKYGSLPIEEIPPDVSLPTSVFVSNQNRTLRKRTQSQYCDDTILNLELIEGNSQEAQFMRLVVRMLNFDPEKRPKMAEIEALPFFAQNFQKPNLPLFQSSSSSCSSSRQNTNTTIDSTSGSESHQTLLSLAPMIRNRVFHHGRGPTHRSLPPFCESFPALL